MFACTKAARSLAGTYSIQAGLQSEFESRASSLPRRELTFTKPPSSLHHRRPVFLHSTQSSLTSLLSSQAPVLSALTKGCKSVEVCQTVEDVPEGCASELVTADVTVHLMVRVSKILFLLVKQKRKQR